MNRVVRIVNAIDVPAADEIFDILTGGLEKPMPESFNWCVIYTLQLENCWVLFRIKIRRVSGSKQ
jgi:hypothetical protein